MLKEQYIEDLVHLRVSEDEAVRMLLELTADKVDGQTVKMIVDKIAQTADPKLLSLLQPLGEGAIDCCGTGGSGLSHFNTSTAVAFVLASGGAKVVKFGNRAMTGFSGSFDFLSALDFPIGIKLEHAPEILTETGLVFLFAPQVYPALSALSAVRKRLKLKTVFNFVGPLLNPCQPVHRLLGVSERGMQEILARYLTKYVVTTKALVVTSESGLDEISDSGLTHLLQVKGSLVEETSCHGQDFFPHANQEPAEASANLGPGENAGILKNIFKGTDTKSQPYRLILLNSAAGFVSAGLSDNLENGMTLASELIRAGAAYDKMENVRRVHAGFSR